MYLLRSQLNFSPDACSRRKQGEWILWVAKGNLGEMSKGAFNNTLEMLLFFWTRERLCQLQVTLQPQDGRLTKSYKAHYWWAGLLQNSTLPFSIQVVGGDTPIVDTLCYLSFSRLQIPGQLMELWKIVGSKNFKTTNINWNIWNFSKDAHHQFLHLTLCLYPNNF